MKNKVLILGISALSFIFSTRTFAQVPVAGFSLSQSSVCVGNTVQVTDASSNSPSAWSYSIEGAFTSTVQNPVVSFTAAGVYSIALIATNGSGDSAPFTTTLLVNALPNVTTSSSSVVCAGSFLTLSGSGANTYTWSGSAIDGVPFVPAASTVYTVTGQDMNGCQNSATIPVTVNSLPVLSITGGTDICIGSSITLSVSGADTYTWTGGSNMDTFTDTPVVTTTYSVSGTNALTGCTNTLTSLITVHALPTILVNSGSICTGGIFTMTPSGASTYTFSSGSSTVSPVSDAAYTVTGTDANGCVSSAAVNVTVFALPSISVNSGSICSGTAFTMTPSGALSYSIYPGGSATVSPSSSTSYSVFGYDVNGCVNAVAAVADITVQTSPSVTINSGAICLGDVFTMVPGGAITYSFANGSNTVSPSANTSYTVIGEDAMGCISSAISSVTVNALPVISVNSGSICAGGIFTMTPSGASSYTFANGSSTVNPTSNSSYSVSGTNANGCVSSVFAIANVTVNALPVVSSANGSVCMGSSYTITTAGASTYSFINGSAIITPASTSSYSFVGVSAAGCVSSNTAVATVSVQALPVLSISGSSAICIGQTATLTVSGASTYSWNNNTSNSATLTVSPSSGITYTVDGTDANGCTSTLMQSLIVNSLPTITVNSGVVCPGGSFTITPTGAVTYSYSGGSAVVMPASSTNYNVTGTDANGCVSAVAVSTVNVVNSLTLTVSGNTTICNGQTANLTASGANTYSWSSSASTNTVALHPSTTTSYTLVGIASGCSDTTVVSVIVHPLPVVTALSTSSVICVGETATLTTGGATTYSWDNGSNLTSIIVSPTITTSYTVTGVDANSCSNKATITQNVSDCTGLTKLENNNLNVGIYPNPSNGEFTIKLSQETSVKILNGIGQVVFANKLVNGDNVVTLNDQPNGIYFVQLKQGEQTKTVKVVKN